jgi:uncharacterized FlaG/YvyC family protein
LSWFQEGKEKINSPTVVNQKEMDSQYKKPEESMNMNQRVKNESTEDLYRNINEFMKGY